MKEHKGIERRKYIRLKSVFPVGFRLLDPDSSEPTSDFQQGFTADVSKGGILLRVNNIKPDLSNLLEKKEVKLVLSIDIPLTGRPVEAVASVAWITLIKEKDRDIYMAGLSFESIAKADRRRLVGYATSLYRVPKLATVALSLLLIAFGINRIGELDLIRENTLLVNGLANVLHKRGVVVNLLGTAGEEKASLINRLEKQEINIAEIEKERAGLLKEEEELRAGIKDIPVLKNELDKARNTRAVLESQLARISLDRKNLQDELKDITSREEERLRDLERLEKMRGRLEEATVDNMRNWLKVHQNKRTGLAASYEGDGDLKNAAFIYDQSLIAEVFLINDDVETSRAILDFFKYKAQRINGGFANAYGANSGAVVEPVVHSGPNIWLGLTMMQYMHRTGSDEYRDLAKDIGDWCIKMQDEDNEGGIRGGPEVAWFATEHNLDAYAFFEMLFQKTGIDRYRKAAQKSLAWIKNLAYTGSSGRIYRGKGDSTIATDTFAWAIAAIGPEALLENGMDPDAIMKFAEDNCKVTVDFLRPDGKTVSITGFDFAKHRHVGRGGVVSSEWTAQMIVSFNVMADFYSKMGDHEKAKLYSDKHTFYLTELEKMVITSPSRSGQGAGCLPYATQDNADTGHGWRTPKGRDTGSVSGTAYAIFAITGHNPLRLSKRESHQVTRSPGHK